ncbi:MAG: zf-HC2 domain-containing protein, partial [Planctomycetota bacterium]
MKPMPQPAKHLDYLLTAYLFENLSAAGRTEVETHLAECSECRNELELLRTVLGVAEVGLHHGGKEYVFEAHRRQRVLEAAKHAPKGIFARAAAGSWRKWSWKLGAVAALLMVLVLGFQALTPGFSEFGEAKSAVPYMSAMPSAAADPTSRNSRMYESEKSVSVVDVAKAQGIQKSDALSILKSERNEFGRSEPAAAAKPASPSKNELSSTSTLSFSGVVSNSSALGLSDGTKTSAPALPPPVTMSVAPQGGPAPLTVELNAATSRAYVVPPTSAPVASPPPPKSELAAEVPPAEVAELKKEMEELRKNPSSAKGSGNHLSMGGLVQIPPYTKSSPESKPARGPALEGLVQHAIPFSGKTDEFKKLDPNVLLGDKGDIRRLDTISLSTAAGDVQNNRYQKPGEKPTFVDSPSGPGARPSVKTGELDADYVFDDNAKRDPFTFTKKIANSDARGELEKVEKEVDGLADGEKNLKIQNKKGEALVDIPKDLLKRAELGDHFETINIDRPDTNGDRNAPKFNWTFGDGGEKFESGGSNGKLLEESIANTSGGGGGGGG